MDDLYIIIYRLSCLSYDYRKIFFFFKRIVNAHIWLFQSSEYRENFILQDKVLWCRFCNIKVDHEKKSILDKHLLTSKHKNNKNKNNSNLQIQKTIPSIVGSSLNEKEKINIEVIEAFTFADIPLEKIEKLKPFLLKHCKNGM